MPPKLISVHFAQMRALQEQTTQLQTARRTCAGVHISSMTYAWLHRQAAWQALALARHTCAGLHISSCLAHDLCLGVQLVDDAHQGNHDLWLTLHALLDARCVW